MRFYNRRDILDLKLRVNMARRDFDEGLQERRGLTAATPMENPYCSCRLLVTRVRGPLQERATRLLYHIIADEKPPQVARHPACRRNP